MGPCVDVRYPSAVQKLPNYEHGGMKFWLLTEGTYFLISQRLCFYLRCISTGIEVKWGTIKPVSREKGKMIPDN